MATHRFKHNFLWIILLHTHTQLAMDEEIGQKPHKDVHNNFVTLYDGTLHTHRDSASTHNATYTKEKKNEKKKIEIDFIVHIKRILLCIFFFPKRKWLEFNLIVFVYHFV